MITVNNFITDILGQMANRDFSHVMFIPLSSGAYMSSSLDGKVQGRRVHAGDEFIADMDAIGIDVLTQKKDSYFLATDDSNVFHKYQLNIEPALLDGRKTGKFAIHLEYSGSLTQDQLNKELRA